MYPGLPTSPVDAGGVSLDRACTKCALSVGGGQSCLPADGRPGGLLVVGDAPTKGAVRPFASKSGAYVRSLVAKTWEGPVAYDYAVKCPAKGGKISDVAKPIKECRAYLAEVIEQVKPERVLAVGPWATLALLGRSLDVESARRGYGWIKGDVPVFIAAAPVHVMMNTFLKRRFEEDVHWALTCDRPTPRHVEGKVHVIEDMDDALEAEAALAQYDELLFDVETAGVQHSKDFTILCAGLAPVIEGADAYVWPANADEGPGLSGVLADVDCRKPLQRLLETKLIAGSNVKYDTTAAQLCLGINIKRVSFDTQLVRKLLDPLAKGRLEYVVELVGRGGSKEEAADYRKKATAAARRKTHKPGEKPHDHWCVQAIRNGAEPPKYNFALLPNEMLWRYNGRDVAGSAAGTVYLRQRAKTQPGEHNMWSSIMQPAIKSFERIERIGFAADKSAFEQFSSFLNVGLDELRQQFKAYGADFNPNSQKQVADILFNKLKLPKGKVSEKSGDPSTDKEVLTGLRGTHPFVDHMIEWRRLEKMDGTYAAGMIPHIIDGRIHPTFRLDGTETMRISSETPNSQNLPRSETVEGKMCRDGFTSSPGNVLIELDQSQIELRVAAGMSGDPDMIEIFKSGLDYHLRTAQLIARIMWNLTEDQVGEFHRQYCKTVNFGLLYGKTDAGLAAQLGITIDEARKLRSAILGKFKKLAAMIKKFLYLCRKTGGIEVPWFDGAAHTRPLYEIAGHDKWKRMNAENSTTNTPIQGRASLYTIAAIPLIHEWIDDVGAPVEIVNTVHDSILLDCPPEWVDRVIAACSDIMTQSFDCWGVPLVADAKVGTRWGSLGKIKRGEKYLDAQVRWAAEALKKSQHGYQQ